MAIYPPTSQLFITDAVADKVYACTQNNGLLSGCIDSGATGLSGPRDIVFVGNTAIITHYSGTKLITCSVSGSSLTGCVESGVIGLFAASKLLVVN